MRDNNTFSQIFFLKKAQGKGSNHSIVYLRVTINGVRTEFSMHRHCDAEHWNVSAGRLHGKTEEVKSFNAFLDSIQFRVFEVYKELISDGVEVTCELFKAKYLGIDIEKPKMLLEVFEEHNQQFGDLVGKEFSIGTYKRFKVCIKSLEEFIQWKYKRSDFEIKKLNFEFIKDYEFYIKTVRNCSHNTAMGYLKKLKKIIRLCVAKDWLIKDPFTAHKITFQETHRIILTKEELQVIKSKPLATQRLEQVRDIFLFSCFTGLSYSDVAKLRLKDIGTGIDGEKWVFTKRTKTETATHVPLLPWALEIIEKYSNAPDKIHADKLLPVISNQRLNSYLKELADVCGIQKELTFHCARHTFATTVTLTNGVPIETVSKMLGHKSIRTTQLYAKILDKKVSDDMMALRHRLTIETD